MAANTPPYDGSELEDDQLLDKFLSDSTTIPDEDCLPDSVCSPASTCASILSCGSPTEAVSSTQILTKVAMDSVKQSKKNVRVLSTVTQVPDGRDVNQKQSRNAIMARENRERKKVYIGGLEESVEHLRVENETYKSKIDLMQRAISALSTDAQYLRGVLKNQSDLSKILQAVASVPGITIKPSLRCVDIYKPVKAAQKRSSMDSTDELQAKSQKTDSGICLHIQNGSISFELCSHCNASSTAEEC